MAQPNEREIRVSVRFDVDDAAKKRLRQEVEGVGAAAEKAVRPLKQLGDRLNEAEAGGKRAALVLKLFGQEINPARILAWGIAWNLGYRAINLVTSLISTFTLGALREVAEFQQRQIMLTAELINLDPKRPYEEASTAARGLLQTLIQLQPAFVGNQQQLQEILLGTARYGLQVDLATEEGRRQFLTLANAISLVTAGINRQGQALQEIRSLAEGVVRPGSQLLQVLRAIDPEITEHLRIWREEGTAVENIVRLLPGYEQASGRIANTISGQWNRLMTNIKQDLREIGQTESVPLARFLAWYNRQIEDARERARRVERERFPGRERTREELERAAALRSVRRIEDRPRELSLEELNRMFEMRRVLQQFTTGGEIRAIGEILIPRTVKELEAARKEAERLFQRFGEDAEETKKAFEDVKRLELDLIRLESQRLALAEDLANQYKRHGELLIRALEGVVEANARAREGAAGVGIGAAGLFESLLRGRLEDRTLSAADTTTTFARIRQQQQFVFQQRQALLRAELRDTDILPEPQRSERRARIAQELINLIFQQADAQAQLNREEREATETVRQRDRDSEIAFLRAKLSLLRAIGDAAGVEAAQKRIKEIEDEQNLAAEISGLNATQLRALIDTSMNALLSGRLSFEDDPRVRARIFAMQKRLSELRTTETGDEDAARKAVEEAAQLYTDILKPALDTVVSTASSIADAALKRTQELHQDIVKAWSAMGTDAARAFIKALEDEFGRIPSIFNRPPGQPRGGATQPMAGGGATSFVHSGTNIFINGMEVALSESAKQEILSAVMGNQGDVAMQRERRFIGSGGAVA